MGYYDTDEEVEQYISMAEGFDGAELLAALEGRLAAGASVLELGMGAGKDLELLAARGYQPVGSDASEAFLRRYREQGGRFESLHLDAERIETERRFDCVYSNKVLHHLTREAVANSLKRQAELTHAGGYLLHSFWHGQGEETFKGMLVTYQDEASLASSTPASLELVETRRYAEFEEGDSMWALWRVR